MKSLSNVVLSIVLAAGLSAFGCGDDGGSGTTATSNGTTSNGTTGTSNGTTATSNGTTATSNGTTATSNGTTATSNGTTATSNGTTATSNGTTTTECTEIPGAFDDGEFDINYDMNNDALIYQGAKDDNLLLVEFYFELGATSEAHTFTLDGENYETCNTCVLMGTGCGDQGCEKLLLGSSGTLDVTTLDLEAGQLAFDLSDVEFVEVSINSETFESTLVPGGDLLCLPSYEGGGEFGIRGHCEEPDAPLCNQVCEELDAVDTSLAGGNAVAEYVEEEESFFYTVETEDGLLLQLEWYFTIGASDMPGTVEFDGENYATCNTCALLGTECGEEGCENFYIALGGSMDVISLDLEAGSAEVDLSNVVFVKADIDFDATFESSVEADAASLCLADLSLPLEVVEEPEWSYEGDTGPASWGDLSEEWATCGSGTMQSPIDIVTANIAVDNIVPGVAFNYTTTAVNILNDGHTVQVNVDEGSTLVVGEDSWNLTQIHFHAQSEHTWDGVADPLEMHLVHTNAEGELTVVSIGFEEGEANAVLAGVFDNLPSTEQEETTIEEATVDLSALIGLLPDMASMHYPGSKTTPPCEEQVNWILMKKIPASIEQIAAFEAIFDNNYRPVQELNGRVVMMRGEP